MGEAEQQEVVRAIKAKVQDALRSAGMEPGRMDLSGLSDGFCRLSIELKLSELGPVPTPKIEIESEQLVRHLAQIVADILDYRLIPGQIRCGEIAKALRAASSKFGQ